jgi:hypothetical protein
MDGDTFISTLECSEHYIQTHSIISSHLSSGLLQLALAFRDNRSVCRIDDIRSEFDNTCTIDTDDSSRAVFTEGDDIQLFCGLPPPALRKAKVQFRLALEEVLKLSALAQEINTLTAHDKEASGLSIDM